MRKSLLHILAALPVALASTLSAQDTTSAPSSVVPLDRTDTAPRRQTNGGEVDTVDRIVAVVGSSVITWSDVVTAVNQQRARGMQLPPDAEGQLRVARMALNELVDEEILIQKATDLNVEVTDQELNSAVDNRVREVRSNYKDEIEYRQALRESGFGSPEEFRRSMVDQARRYLLQRNVYQALQKNAKPASVTDEEVDQAFQRAREQLRQRPPTVTFRQLIITPTPSPAQDSAARHKADSLLAELKKGENFEAIAKRESMDPGSKDQGGDLGWHRRGEFVPEFEAVMFSLRPGQLSPVTKTQFGYHIIRVDRVQPAEVRVSHILISPTIDSADIARTRTVADSAAKLWAAGMNYDSLVVKFHDDSEGKGALDPRIVDSLPEPYRVGIADVGPNQISKPFELPVGNSVKFAVVQVVSRTALGEYSLPEIRQLLRRQLAEEKQSRAILDELRQRTYVSVRL